MALKFLSVDELLTRAASISGLTDFGVGFEEGLEILIEGVCRDINLNKNNVERLAAPIIKLLVSRAYSERGWRDHPLCLAQSISGPVVVTGIPRTGTTMLHKLLALDDQFQGLEQWLIGNPMIRPPRDYWENNPLYITAVKEQDELLETVPVLRVAHEVCAHEVDECLNLLAQSFVSNYPACAMGVPFYDKWWRRQDEVNSYRRFADNLSLIGADEPERTWLLKNPGHITHLEALFKVFPDARVIQTHRDPAESIPSICGVIWPLKCFLQDRWTPPEEVGMRELDLWSESVAHSEITRVKNTKQIFDVRYVDFVTNPMNVVKNIYKHFDLRLGDETVRKMEIWLATNVKDRHGKHVYSSEDYGLTKEMIWEKFDAYMNRFDL